MPALIPAPPYEFDEKHLSDSESEEFFPAEPFGSSANIPANGFKPGVPGSSKGKDSDIIERDASYYMESSFMVFQVQKCLFRIPSYLFSNESHVFGGMFHLPQSTSEGTHDTEGSSPTNPIILPDEYMKEDFRSLMKALYPLSFSLNLKLSTSEWTSVLKLSTQWYFINLREVAISEIERLNELNLVEKILLGRKYRISSWMVEGFCGLVNNTESISDDEAIDIDSDYITTAYKLYRMREYRITERSPFIAENHIEDIFGPELQSVRADEKGYKAPQEEIEFKRPPSPEWGFMPPSSPEWGFMPPPPKLVFMPEVSFQGEIIGVRESSIKKNKKKK
ncbi:hypothetical protein CVT25_005055 [Psilocybe cyanescens]|uniref:BTB domain-containing protein n=1 Tax=Psilocybe cyanescens TaxID=93625 RepID=A0A409XDW9_PSICY|nr:hypothetical protein CVT25_005055 [Psilocybe cyanescens]